MIDVIEAYLFAPRTVPTSWEHFNATLPVHAVFARSGVRYVESFSNYDQVISDLEYGEMCGALYTCGVYDTDQNTVMTMRGGKIDELRRTLRDALPAVDQARVVDWPTDQEE